MKTECSVVRDLLPLYIENMVSEETTQYINEHLKNCDDCKAELANLKEGVELSTIETRVAPKSDDAKPFKK